MFGRIQFIFIVLVVILMGVFPWLPPFCKSLLYGLSLSLKSLILFMLPFLIFGLIYQTCADLGKKSSRSIGFLLAGICISNFASTMFSYCAGQIVYAMDLEIKNPVLTRKLEPLFVVNMPSFFSNSHAMIAGAILGMCLSLFMPSLNKRFSSFLNHMTFALLKSIVCIVPFFVAGFIVKMMDDGLFVAMLKSYAVIFGIVGLVISLYIVFLYYLGSNLHMKTCLYSIKNMLPSAFLGLGSMSSAAAMPLTILGVEKNTYNPTYAKSLIPATVNVHLMGDCIAIPIFALALLKSFGADAPSLVAYLPFAFAFIIAKFSVAAVPGGGILVMLPILEKKMGLGGEMLSMITTLYILFDPVITSANILGNGAFAQIMDRLISHRDSKKVL